MEWCVVFVVVLLFLLVVSGCFHVRHYRFSHPVTPRDEPLLPHPKEMIRQQSSMIFISAPLTPQTSGPELNSSYSV